LEIIGRGTWYDKVASEIVERERKLGRSLDLIRTEMGIGISGIPHIGHLGDAARSYAVTLALREQGYGSELIAFADDEDGLRTVPAGLPKSLEKYLGYPVRNVPDPYSCHESFAEHMISLLLEILDTCGMEYEFVSGAEAYQKGLFNKEIETLLGNAERIGEIIREEVGQEKYEEVLPYLPVCSNCGRIYTTKAYDFVPEEDKVLYTCEGMEIKGQWLEGCGHKGEANYAKGEGKISWKAGEFATRWKVLDIRFEAYGKDIADSVRVNDRICREILDYEPPVHAQYEMFLDKSGKKISKSAGNVFTPQVWFRYGSSQSLLLLMLKRFVGTRNISVMNIPQYMNEMDDLEDIYFGRKKTEDKKESAKLRGLYEYCWLLKPPQRPRIHVPYNLLTYLAKVAPKDSVVEFITEKLRDYRYVEDEVSDDLKTRIGYAQNWVRDFAEIKETTVELSLEEKHAVKQLMETIRSEEEADKIQSAIFDIARRNGIKPKRFFQTLYTLLLGATSGPRLGPYIIDMGKENVIEALKRSLRLRQG